MPKALRVFLALDVGLLALAGVCETYCRFVLGLLFPYASPLLFEYFPDIVRLRERFHYFHTLRFYTDLTSNPCMYPAPVAVLYRLVFAFAPFDLGVFVVFMLLSFVVWLFSLGRLMNEVGLARRTTILFLVTVFMTSYPFWFEFRQANMEICIWVIVMTGLVCFLKGRGYSAAACFGIAGCMKIFPFLYLGLLLARRQYRQIVLSFLVAAAVTIPSLWLVYPHVLESWRLTSKAVDGFRFAITLRTYPQMSFDHSIFGFFKVFAYPRLTPQQLNHALSVYLAIAAVAILLVYFWKIRSLPVLNQILCLSVASIVLPPTSFDYTLIHLYAPWALLVLLALTAQRNGRQVAGLVGAFVCFAILMAPEAEIIFRAYSYAGQVKAVTLLALFFIGLRYPFTMETSKEFAIPAFIGSADAASTSGVLSL